MKFKNIILIRTLIVISLFVLTCSGLESQINDDRLNFGSLDIMQSQEMFDNELIRKAEYNLLESIKQHPYASTMDMAVLLQADIDLWSENYSVAEVKLTEFIIVRSNSPLVPFAAIQRAYILFAQKKYDYAEMYFEHAFNLASRDYDSRRVPVYRELAHAALYWRGISMAQQGKYHDAIPYFENSIDYFPNGEYVDDSHFAMARIYESNRDHTRAIEEYTNVYKTNPYSPFFIVSHLRKANNHIALRQPSNAISTLEDAEVVLNRYEVRDSIGLLYSPQFFAENAREQLIYLRGDAQNLAGNYRLALSIFTGFLETYKDSEFTSYTRMGAGWANLNLGNNSDAILQYEEIIRNSEPEDKLHSLALLYRAVALKRNGEVEKARRELSALTLQSAYPYLAEALLELGQIHYETGDYEQARRLLERADREVMDSRISTRISLLLGACYIELRMWERAVIEYKKAEDLANKSNEIIMPMRKWYISEAKLKQGSALVQVHRSSEALAPLLAFTAENKGDKRMDEALFWLAEAYYRSDMLNNAVETYNNLIDNHSSSPRREESLYGLGWSYFRLQNFSQSQRIFDMMISEFPKSRFAIEAYTRLGDGYYLRKSFGEAANSYRKAVRLTPGSEEGQYAAYQLSHALFRQGAYEQAISASLDFVRMYPRSAYAPNSLYLIGWIRFQQQRYNEAIDNFNFLMQTYAQSNLIPRANYAIGDSYYNMGDYERAIQYYKIVIEEFPGSPLAPEAFKSVQFSLMALGREDEAVEILDTYIDANIESPFVQDFQYKKGELFYQGRRYADAIDEYERFISQHPTSPRTPEVLYWKGKSYANINDTRNAERTFEQLVREYPDNEFAPVGLLEFGLLNKEMANIRKSDSLFRELQTRYPTHQTAAQAGFERAVLKFMLGDTTSALVIFREVADNFPTYDYGYQSRYRLGMFYRNRSEFDNAITEFQKLALNQDNMMLAAESQYRVGELMMRQEKYQDAITAFISVKENFSGYEDWYSLSLLSLGEAYEKTEDIELARQVYTLLEQWRPDDDYGNTARNRIRLLKNR